MKTKFFPARLGAVLPRRQRPISHRGRHPLTAAALSLSLLSLAAIAEVNGAAQATEAASAQQQVASLTEQQVADLLAEFDASFKKGQGHDRMLEIRKQLVAQPLTVAQSDYLLQKSIVVANNRGYSDMAAQFLEEYRQFVEHNPSDARWGKYYFSKAQFDVQQVKMADAEQAAWQAVTYLKKTEETTLLAHSYRTYLHALNQSGQYQKALGVVDEVLAANKATGRLDMYLEVRNVERDIYLSLKWLDKAMASLQESMQLVEQNRATLDNLGNYYYAAGETYYTLKEYQKAQDAFAKAYEADMALGLESYSGWTLIKWGRSKLALNDFDGARHDFEQALATFEKYKHTRNIGWAKNNLGELALKQGDYPTAKDWYEQAARQLTAQNGTLYVENSLSLANVHGKLGEAVQAEVLLKGLDLTNITDTSVLMHYQQALAEVYQQLKQPELALSHFKQYLTIKAERDEHSYNQQVAGMKVQLGMTEQEAVLRQERQQRELEQALAKNRQLQIVLVAGLGILLLGMLAWQLRRRQRALLQKTEQLSASLSANERLIADVSHELRTPLTVLKLQIETLESNLVSDTALTYQQLHQRIAMLNTLIGDMYQLSSAQSQQLQWHDEVVELAPLTEQIFEQQKPLFVEKGLTLQFDCQWPAELAYVELDPHRFEQLMMNLLRNSLHYTDAPGRVVISLSAVKIGEQAPVAPELADGILVKICDSAPGLSDDELSQMFSRLYRGQAGKQRDKQGSGLGLAICKALVDAQQGQIVAEHSALGGICMLVTLPLHRVAESAPELRLQPS